MESQRRQPYPTPAPLYWEGLQIALKIGMLPNDDVSSAVLSGVLWRAEGCPIPAELQESFPEFRQDQWNAVLRLATLIFTALESEPSRSA